MKCKPYDIYLIFFFNYQKASIFCLKEYVIYIRFMISIYGIIAKIYAWIQNGLQRASTRKKTWSPFLLDAQNRAWKRDVAHETNLSKTIKNLFHSQKPKRASHYWGTRQTAKIFPSKTSCKKARFSALSLSFIHFSKTIFQSKTTQNPIQNKATRLTSSSMSPTSCFVTNWHEEWFQVNHK